MEIEFKLLIPPERLAAVDAAVRDGEFSVTRMRAHYFDTPEGDLAFQGMALRLRKEGDEWVQTLKAQGRGPLVREEHNVSISDPESGGPLPAPDPLLHAGSAVGDRLMQVLRAAEGCLGETYGTEIERVTRTISLGDGIAELALDTGQVVARRGTPGEKTARVCELELELKSGKIAGLVDAAAHWAVTHGLHLSTVSKAERGERLMAEGWARPAVKAQAMHPFRHHLPHGRELLRAAVTNCLPQILNNASEILEESGDETHVHQLRVGLRRMRTALSELGHLSPGAVNAEWEPPLKEVFQQLGELRDRDQVIREIDSEIQSAGGPAVQFPPVFSTAAGKILHNGVFQAALIRLLGFAAEERDESTCDPCSLDAKQTRRALQKRLQKLHKKIQRDAPVFSKLSPEEQHRTRKRIKRLRYLTEFLAPALKGGGDAFLSRLEPAQAALGRLNDEQVAERLYRDIAPTDPQAWFGVGWLTAQRDATMAACQHALSKLGDGPQLRKAGIR